MPARQNDQYANMLSAQVTLADGSVEGTEINLGISLGTGTGILIDQIDYYTVGAKQALADGKSYRVGFAVSAPANIDTMTIDNKSIVHFIREYRVDLGTAGNGVILEDPTSKQFFPPIIVAAPRIYLIGEADSSSGANAKVIRARMMYRYVDLKTQDYLEIAESFVLVG